MECRGLTAKVGCKLRSASHVLADAESSPRQRWLERVEERVASFASLRYSSTRSGANLPCLALSQARTALSTRSEPTAVLFCCILSIKEGWKNRWKVCAGLCVSKHSGFEEPRLSLPPASLASQHRRGGGKNSRGGVTLSFFPFIFTFPACERRTTANGLLTKNCFNGLTNRLKI